MSTAAQAHYRDHDHHHERDRKHRDDDRRERDRDRDRYWGEGRHYFGASAVFASENFDDAYGFLDDRDVDVEDGFGFGLRFGTRFQKHFAAELHYEFIDEFDVSVAGLDSFDVESWMLGANMRLYPFKGVVEPYAMLGSGVMHARLEDELDILATEKSTGFAARFGGGVDIHITEALALNFEASYVTPAGDEIEDLDYVSLGWGLQFHF